MADRIWSAELNAFVRQVTPQPPEERNPQGGAKRRIPRRTRPRGGRVGLCPIRS
jgi:hypothetical protein